MIKLLKLIRDQRRQLQGLDETVYIHCCQRPSDEYLGSADSLDVLQGPDEPLNDFLDRVAAKALQAGTRFAFVHFMRTR